MADERRTRGDGGSGPSGKRRVQGCAPDSTVPFRASTAGGDNPALRRVLRRPGAQAALELLAETLPGADLATLLLEVFRRRAAAVTAAEVMRGYGRDRFTSPAVTGFMELRRAEDALLASLPAGFEIVTLAPLVPLAAHSAVAPVDPRNVVATARRTEVAADPTNGLALEAALRRRSALTGDPRSATLVRLAASQRVVRAQMPPGRGFFAHFQLFGLVTAGRDTGGHTFERQQAIEHLRFAAAAMAAAGAARTEIRMTCLSSSLDDVIAAVRGELAGIAGLDIVDAPDRARGHGYYTGACFKIFIAADAGEAFEVGDGGFVDWTRQLVGNSKERLLISGFGIDRVAVLSPPGNGP
jgi:hypothetical protein